MADTELKQKAFHKELDLIQAVITRMAENSFKVKAWLIGVLVAIVGFKSDAIFAQADSTSLPIQLGLNALLFLPIICFWYLDAFFLRTEKLYREVYRWVVTYRPSTDAYLYDLNTFTRKVELDGETHTERLFPKAGTIWQVMRSKTLLPFYLMPMVFVVGLLVHNLFWVAKG